MNIVSPGFFDTGMGAAEEVLEGAYDMAVMGRQGDPRELKGVSRVPFLYFQVQGEGAHADGRSRFTSTSRRTRRPSRPELVCFVCCKRSLDFTDHCLYIDFIVDGGYTLP